MRIFLLSLGLFGLVFSSTLCADDGGMKPKPAMLSKDMDKDWTLELGSGVQFANVRTSGLESYTLVPVDLTAALKVDDVSLDDFWGGVFRGNTEFFFRGYGVAIPSGIESRIVGIGLGPRYNFVQPGWKIVPFVDGLVGFGFADSRGTTDSTGRQTGLGQDFNFQFGVAGGFRYDFTEEWFVRLAGVYTHFSNAGLSEPARKNRAIDAAGPELSVGYRF